MRLNFSAWPSLAVFAAVTRDAGSAKGQTSALTTKSSTTAGAVRPPAIFAFTTASKRVARSARAAAFARTVEFVLHAKNAKGVGFVPMATTEPVANSVAVAAYVSTIALDLSAKTAGEAKYASTAAKSASVFLLLLNCFLLLFLLLLNCFLLLFLLLLNSRAVVLTCRRR